MKQSIVLLLQLLALVVLYTQNFCADAKVTSTGIVRGPRVEKQTADEIPEISRPRRSGYEEDGDEAIREERRLQGGNKNGGGGGKNKNKNKETESPTMSPTNPPTTPPTNLPTPLPTNPPTNLPTPRPSNRPTIAPTPRPSNRPTMAPTKAPVPPTNPPTSGPTNSPTYRPTPRPTFLPTAGPTHSPTNVPTVPPIYHPTGLPTNLPTDGPTNTPTVRPTPTPTARPTFDLTRFVDVEKLEPIIINVTVSNFTKLSNEQSLENYFKGLIEGVLDSFNQEWYPSYNKSIDNVTLQFLPAAPITEIQRVQRNSVQTSQAQIIIDGQVFVHAKERQQSNIKPSSSFNDSFDYSMLLYFTFWGVDDVEEALTKIGGLENPVINSVSIGEKKLIGVGDTDNSLIENNVGDSNAVIPQLIDDKENQSASRASKREFLSFALISASTICWSLLWCIDVHFIHFYSENCCALCKASS